MEYYIIIFPPILLKTLNGNLKSHKRHKVFFLVYPKYSNYGRWVTVKLGQILKLDPHFRHFPMIILFLFFLHKFYFFSHQILFAEEKKYLKDSKF